MSLDEVFWQGESQEAIIGHVTKIESAIRSAAQHPDENVSRGLADLMEFSSIIERVRNWYHRRSQYAQAKPILRKVFRQKTDKCNLMQEIWIEDKSQTNPLKQYIIVHLHHHTSVLPHDLEVFVLSARREKIDAANVRNLADTKTMRCPNFLFDNPYVTRDGQNICRTAIEPSGRGTLKIFPTEKTWVCREVGKDTKCTWLNRQTAWKCNRPGCSCLRPCALWDWEKETHREEDLAFLLKVSHECAEGWLSGGRKDRFRGVSMDANAPDGGFRTIMTGSQVLERLEVSKQSSRVCGLLVGIDGYEVEQDLKNCAADVKLMVKHMEDASTPSNKFLITSVGVSSEHVECKTVKKSIKTFGTNMAKLEPRPEIMMFYFAGHGRRYSGIEYILASDFDSSDESNFTDEMGCLRVRWIVDSICEKLGAETAKFFFFDACHEGSPEGRDQYSRLPKNTLLVFATQPGETSSDGGREESNSPFCKILAKHIFKPGSSLDHHINNAVEELYEKQQPEVRGSMKFSELVVEFQKNVSSTVLCNRVSNFAEDLQSQSPMSSLVDLSVAQDIDWDTCHTHALPQEKFEAGLEGAQQAEIQNLSDAADDMSRWSRELNDAADVEDLSEADTRSISSGGFMVHMRGDISGCSASMRMLEAYVSKWTDYNWKEFWSNVEGRDVERLLVEEIHRLASDEMRKMGLVADSAIESILTPMIAEAAGIEQREVFIQLWSEHVWSELDLLKRVNKLAVEGFFRSAV